MITVSIELPVFTVIPLIFSNPNKIVLSKQNKEPLILENDGFSFNLINHKVLEITILSAIEAGQFDVLITDLLDEIIFNGVLEFRTDAEISVIESLQKNENTTVEIGRYKIKR